MPTASIEMIERKLHISPLLKLAEKLPACQITIPHRSAVSDRNVAPPFLLSEELNLQSADTILHNSYMSSSAFVRSIVETMRQSIIDIAECSCVRCTFEKSAKAISFKNGEMWIIGTENGNLSNFEAMLLAGMYQSQMKLSYAAAVYASIILSSSSQNSYLRDALHGLATLLLEAVTTANLDNSENAVHVRRHWRSACKLWLACNTSGHDISIMALQEHDKLKAFGRYEFIGNMSEYPVSEEVNTKAVPFSSISINKHNNRRENKLKISFNTKTTDSDLRYSKCHNICITTQPIISAQDCEFLVKTAEHHASKVGWATNRHYAVPTTDVPIHEIPVALEWFFFSGFYDRLRHTLFEQLPDDFDGNPESLYINDAFLVRYSVKATENVKVDDVCDSVEWGGKIIHLSSTVEERQSFLPLHTDQSTHSVVISLNSGDNFLGGGTYFADLHSDSIKTDSYSIKNGVVSPSCGHMVTFPGCWLRHAGEPISSGTRYIMTLFLFLGKNSEEGNCTGTSSIGDDDDNIDEDDGNDGYIKKRKGEIIIEVQQNKKVHSSTFGFNFFD